MLPVHHPIPSPRYVSQPLSHIHRRERSLVPVSVQALLKAVSWSSCPVGFHPRNSRLILCAWYSDFSIEKMQVGETPGRAQGGMLGAGPGVGLDDSNSGYSGTLHWKNCCCSISHPGDGMSGHCWCWETDGGSVGLAMCSGGNADSGDAAGWEFSIPARETAVTRGCRVGMGTCPPVPNHFPV